MYHENIYTRYRNRYIYIMFLKGFLYLWLDNLEVSKAILKDLCIALGEINCTQSPGIKYFACFILSLEKIEKNSKMLVSAYR